MKIFLSSTYQDLIAHRKAAAEAIERLGQQPIRMEAFGAMPLEPTSACLEEISDSDTLIGLYAHRYGYTPQGKSKSITEQEFDYALKKRKPILCFVVKDKHRWARKHVEKGPGRTRLREFLNRIREKFVRGTFTSPDNLAFKVASSLGRFLLKRYAKYERKKNPALQGARLLLVNNTPGKMSHVIEMLRDLGIDVQVTSSKGALGAVSKETYDLVVLDMKVDAKLIASLLKRGIPVTFTAGRLYFDLTLPPPPTFNMGLNLLVLDGLKQIRATTSGWTKSKVKRASSNVRFRG